MQLTKDSLKSPIVNGAIIETASIVFFLYLYLTMALWGRGAYWSTYEPVNLYFILLTFPFIFILNIYILIPHLARPSKWILYLISIAGLQFCIEFARIICLDNSQFRIFGLRNTTIPFIIGLLSSWIFVLTKNWVANARIIAQLHADKIQSELDFLKVQVDPHFLFNSLNSIYALALEENSTKTADSIVMLSALMRYNLHDSNQKAISIYKEITYIEKYIALQKLRLSETNTLDIFIHVEQNCPAQIAPLILIPFIENIFKHGISLSKNTHSIIKIIVENGILDMMTENDIVGMQNNETSQGLGLGNVKKRLELLYKNNYQLLITSRANRYYTHLKIKLL